MRMASNSLTGPLSCIQVAIALAFMLILLVAKPHYIAASAQDIKCTGPLRDLANQCGPFVKKGAPKKDPSWVCCDAVRRNNIPCLCQNLPMEIERLLDMELAIYVLGFCGKPLAHGSKCGSYTVP